MTLVGKQFGNYQIIELLGEGAVSHVYRARQDESTVGDVALKVIKPKLANYDEFLERFKREARISSTLDHPHIIKVFDSGEIGETHYLSMMALYGGSLAQRSQKQRLSLDTISAMLDQITSALDYAHSKQIVHRDLKPENILFDHDDNAILTDFGMMKLLNTEGITAANAVLGTPAYMSPEQCSLKPVDKRSDIYSLGVILFELLTGELPFEAPTSMAMMAAHVRTTPPLASSKQPKVSPELDQLVNRALSKNPADRFESAGELAAEFKRITAGAAPIEKRTKTTAKLKGDVLPSVVQPQVKATAIGRKTQTADAADKPNAPSGRMIGLLIVIVAAVLIMTVAIVFLLGSMSIPTN